MLLTDHPLANSLWQTKTGKKVELDVLRVDVVNADYLLLGEKHDNPIHHDRQAMMVGMLREAGKTGQLILEMAEPSHEATLANAGANDIDTLGTALDWEQRGWPSWTQYQPIIAEAMAASMRLKPGNPEKIVVRSVGRGGALDDSQLEDLRWDVDYSPTHRDSLLDELVDAHCGMMDKKALAPLVTMQRLKDAFMARSMRQSRAREEVSVLIAGNGHTRKDRAVPMFLDDTDQVLSVALVEVVRDETDQASYPSFDPALYDYVWFSPRLDEIDPCERFREQLERMKSGMGKHGKK